MDTKRVFFFFLQNDGYTVCTLKDITENTEITASSRPAMVPNLIDQTTETFWESSEDDKNKFKTITIQCTRPFEEPKAVYVHFDNCRDLNVSIHKFFWWNTCITGIRVGNEYWSAEQLICIRYTFWKFSMRIILFL